MTQLTLTVKYEFSKTITWSMDATAPGDPQTVNPNRRKGFGGKQRPRACAGEEDRFVSVYYWKTGSTYIAGLLLASPEFSSLGIRCRFDPIQKLAPPTSKSRPTLPTHMGLEKPSRYLVSSLNNGGWWRLPLRPPRRHGGQQRRR